MTQLTLHERDDLNSSITIRETEFVIKKFPQKKSPGPDDFTGSEYQCYTISSRKEKRLLSNLLYKVGTKLDKDHTQNEKHRPISLMNTDAKILNKTVAMRIQ